MAPKSYGDLTPAETERLALLIEECGEVIQAATKVLRFGYDAAYPDGELNRAALMRELGDLGAVVRLLIKYKDVEEPLIRAYSIGKAERIWAYLRYNRPRDVV